jgi:hypothetical protein
VLLRAPLAAAAAVALNLLATAAAFGVARHWRRSKRRTTAPETSARRSSRASPGRAA